MTQPVGWAPQPQVQVGPAPGIVYGGFWIRLVACIIDVVIILVVDLICSAIGIASLGSLLALVYILGTWGFLGQTVGMIPFGLRIVRAADGAKMTWGNVILRFIGFIVEGLLSIILIGLLGFIWAAFDSRKQAWHDKIGGTVVIKNV